MTAQTDVLDHTADRAGAGARSSRLRSRLWADRWVYVFLLPTAVLFSAYTIWPIISSWYYSMLDWTGLGSDRSFIGLDNYVEAYHDPLFWSSLGITLLFVVVTVPIRVALAMAAALVLNNPRLPFARLFRTALFVPVVTTTAIIGIVAGFVFDPGGGPVNSFLQELGIVDEPIDFLGSPHAALATVMGVHIWKWLGITLVYWLAALQTVPTELYEAAQVDGASRWRAFRHVTVPLLKPFTVIIVLLTAVETLQVFDLVLTMTAGGPFFATNVTEVYIYSQAFASSSPRLGYGAALGVLFGILTLLLALVQAVGLRYVQRTRSAT